MSLPSIVLFVHVVSAVILVGHSLAMPLIQSSLRNATTISSVRDCLQMDHKAARVTPFFALALLASGIYLASDRWAEGWLPVSVVLFVLNSVLAVAFEKRIGDQLANLASGASSITSEMNALRHSPAWSVTADVMIATDFAALFLMSVQPRLTVAIAISVCANAAVLVRRALKPDARTARTSASLPNAN